MKAIETSASFNEKGEITIHNLPAIKNKQAKLLFLFEEETDDNFYAYSVKGLSRAYADDEPEYDMSMVKEPNPSYKDDRR